MRTRAPRGARAVQQYQYRLMCMLPRGQRRRAAPVQDSLYQQGKHGGALFHAPGHALLERRRRRRSSLLPSRRRYQWWRRRQSSCALRRCPATSCPATSWVLVHCCYCRGLRVLPTGGCPPGWAYWRPGLPAYAPGRGEAGAWSRRLVAAPALASSDYIRALEIVQALYRTRPGRVPHTHMACAMIETCSGRGASTVCRKDLTAL